MILQCSVFAKNDWKQIKTKNFTLIGNAKEKKIKKVGIKLEQFRESMLRLVPELSKDSQTTKRVIVFKDNKSFQPYKLRNSDGKITDWIVGYFQAGYDTDYIALTIENKGSNPYQTIFHEYTHNLIDYNYGRKNIPTWFNEGMSEYYDQIRIRKDRFVSVGEKKNSHLQLLKQKGLIPIDKFLNVNYTDLRKMSLSDATHFYAQSWVMFHYFMSLENKQGNLQLNKFIDLVLRNKDANRSFNEAFVTSNNQFENKLIHYIQNIKKTAKTTELQTNLTTEFVTETRYLDSSEVDAYLGDLLYQRNKLKESKKHLLEAIKLDQNLSLALSTLGLLNMKLRNYEDADKYLKLATQTNNADYLVFYRYAYFLSRELLTFDKFVSNYTDKRAEGMRALLHRSIALNPDFPESYHLLAFINLVRNENYEKSIEYLKKAIKLSPKKELYFVHLARFHLLNKKFDEAFQIATNISELTNDESIKSRTDEIIARIQKIKNELAVAKKTNQTFHNSNISKSDSPKNYTDEELIINRKQTLNERIIEVLRKPKLGEKRILGEISEIKCFADKVFIELKTQNETKVLQRDSLRGLYLFTYIPEMRNGLLECGQKLNNITAILIYKPNKDILSESLGEVVSIEFVPNDFELAIKN